MNTDEAIAFLKEASRYFSTRPTNGEDGAHWSNVYNAENCDKIASLIDSQRAGLAQMEEQWNRLQDWLQALLKAHEYYRQEIECAMVDIDADDVIGAYDILEEALNNKEYKLEWKEWKPDEQT